MGACVAEVITGEAVVLDVPFARFPSRAVALAIDLAVQLILLAALSGVAIAAGLDGGLDAAAVAAIGLTVSVLIIVGYPAAFETLSRGRTLGKLAMGLRVVSDDGGPERFRQALMRALAGVLEIWLTLGFLALVTSLLSSSGKRLGDIFAGTFVITVRLPRQPPGHRPDVGAAAGAGRLGGDPGTVRAQRRDRGDRPPVPEPVLRAQPGRPGGIRRPDRRGGGQPGHPGPSPGHHAARLPERGPGPAPGALPGQDDRAGRPGRATTAMPGRGRPRRATRRPSRHRPGAGSGTGPGTGAAGHGTAGQHARGGAGTDRRVPAAPVTAQACCQESR